MNLLDTDMVSLLHSGHPRLKERMSRTDPSDIVATTVITEAEVLRGRYEYLLKAEDGNDLQRALRWLESSKALLADFQIVSVDAAAAARFDELRRQQKLRKIGRADLLIASIALGHGATLVPATCATFARFRD